MVTVKSFETETRMSQSKIRYAALHPLFATALESPKRGHRNLRRELLVCCLLCSSTSLDCHSGPQCSGLALFIDLRLSYEFSRSPVSISEFCPHF